MFCWIVEKKKEGISDITCKLLSVFSGLEGQLALFPVLTLQWRTIHGNEALNHGLKKVGSSVYSKLARGVCTERVFHLCMEAQNTRPYTSISWILGFSSVQRGRVVSVTWHLFSRETFCTIFLGSKAVGEAAVLQISKLRASWKLMIAASICALVWKTLLLTMRCPDLSFSVSCKCCSLEQMKEETVCKRANKDSTRREKMIWIKKDGHDKHTCIGYE